MVAGVAGGIAEHLNVDPVLIRLSFVALAFAGVGIVLYIVGWIVIPEASGDEPPAQASTAPTDTAMAGRIIFGSILVGVGCLMLLDWAFPVGKYLWPVALIVLGVGVFAYGTRR